MILNFRKTTRINKLSRQVLGWFITMQNKSRETLSDKRHCQESSAGGMFGLLVSSDVTHRH